MRLAVQARVAAAAGVVAVTACILPGGQRVEPIPGTAGVVVTSPQTPQRGPSRKRVKTKQDPDLLIAEDGTSCRVSTDRYREVEIGTDQLCSWQAEVLP